ncbi:hypothetical protein HLB44_32825 [Aquincola sp. S2]|uniref:Phasin family protein n=1 Tax=Pseudaquabacterium terrae TaxID=2732868 RepID=A0ABX2ESU2_9BURK|nr:hypothetical protein [Aquabacterium terrae]NRF71780.1 hypothetical protein [Aquabacterium terrae]
MPETLVPTAAPSAEVLSAALPWFGAGTAALFELQRTQFSLLFAWQQAFAAVQKELWDEWVSRWGGGVPIDA